MKVICYRTDKDTVDHAPFFTDINKITDSLSPTSKHKKHTSLTKAQVIRLHKTAVFCVEKP
jgi:hypothetical protein